MARRYQSRIRKKKVKRKSPLRKPRKRGPKKKGGRRPKPKPVGRPKKKIRKNAAKKKKKKRVGRPSRWGRKKSAKAWARERYRKLHPKKLGRPIKKDKRKPKSWRKYLRNNLLPPRFALVDNYSDLINNICQIAIGKSKTPKSIYEDVLAGFMAKSNSSLLNTKPQLEDIKQQCYVYLMEIWTWYLDKWRRNSRYKRIQFYDYIREKIPKLIGNYLGRESRREKSEYQWPNDLIVQPENSLSYELNLQWVTTRDGLFKQLSIQQRYLLYLYFNQEMSINEIAILNRQQIEQVKSELKKILRILGVKDVITWNNSKNSTRIS